MFNLKKFFPEAKLTFVGRPFIRELLGGWDIALIPFSKSFKESLFIRREIKNHDVAIVPHRSLRSALIILSSGIKRRIGFDRSEFRWAFTDLVPHRWEEHEVDRNLRLLEPLGIEKPVRKTYLPMKEDECLSILNRYDLYTKEYLVVNPFSNFPLKEWSLSNWAELIGMLLRRGEEVVVTGTSSDTKKAEKLSRLVKFKNLVGRTSLRELMGVIKGSKLVISNDSAPVHIANALGVPAFTVYTATSSVYGFYPLDGSFFDNPAPCSPCSPNPKRCKTLTRECLRQPSAESVFKALEKLL